MKILSSAYIFAALISTSQAIHMRQSFDAESIGIEFNPNNVKDWSNDDETVRNLLNENDQKDAQS